MADAEGETEVAHCGNGLHFFFEDILEEISGLEFLDELVVAPVCVDAVGHDAAVLDVLVVGVVGAGDLELVVVEQLRGGVDIIEVLGELVADGSHDLQVVLPADDVLESGGDLAHVAIVLGCTGDQCHCPAEVESQNALHHHYLYTITPPQHIITRAPTQKP